MFELREIDYFIEIVEAGSISKAAAHLYITQPGLSQFLAKLERQVGTPLFSRSNSNLSLTRAGHIYYTNAKKVQAIMKETMQKIEDEALLSSRRLYISAPGERTMRFAAMMTQKLYEEIPFCNISLVEDDATLIFNKVVKNEIDIGIVAMADDDEDLSIERIMLARDEIVLALPRSHRLAGMASGKLSIPGMARIDIQELKGEEFVLLQENTFVRSCCSDYFKQQRFEPSTYILAKNMHTSMSIVESGAGIGFCPVGTESSNPNIVYLALKVPFYQNTYMIYRKDAYRSTIKKRFIELVKENKDLFNPRPHE